MAAGGCVNESNLEFLPPFQKRRRKWRGGTQAGSSGCLSLVLR